MALPEAKRKEMTDSGEYFRPRALMERLSETEDVLDRVEAILQSIRRQGDASKTDPHIMRMLVEDGLFAIEEAKKNREANEILDSVRKDLLAL
jgi:ferritin-like metal-binding protein YciE